jgi:hypothetical protein
VSHPLTRGFKKVLRTRLKAERGNLCDDLIRQIGGVSVATVEDKLTAEIVPLKPFTYDLARSAL